MTMPVVLGHGLNLTSIKDCDLEAVDGLLARYVEIGCTHVEVSARRLDMIVGGRVIEERAAAVAEILARHALKPVLHAHHAINFMDLPNRDMHRAAARANVELARRMGMSSIVLHSGRVPADVWRDSRDGLLAVERDELKRLADQAARSGARLALENLVADPSGRMIDYGADPRAVAEQIAAVGHPALGGCLDFGHAFISAPVMKFDFVDAVTVFSEQVWHLHLHDNCGVPDGGAYGDIGDQVGLGIGDLHAPMGWGAIPWRAVLPRMRFRPGTYGMIELQGRYRRIEAMVAETAGRFAAYWNGILDLDEALPGAAMKEAAE